MKRLGTAVVNLLQPIALKAARGPATVALRKKPGKKPPLWLPPGGGRGGIRRRVRRRVRTFVRRDNVVALVPAVGAGCELSGESKLFLRLGRHTLIEHVVRRLLNCAGSVVVATPKTQIQRTRALLGEAAEVCAAGSGYTETLLALLEFAPAPFVVVHNVSWPFASPRLIRDVIFAAAEDGAASAVDFPGPPIGRVDIDQVADEDDPGRIAIAQSPGAFQREILERAFGLSDIKTLNGETTWELLQRSGTQITPVENEEWNIRIETALDWEIARRAIWPVLRHGPARWRNSLKRDTSSRE